MNITDKVYKVYCYILCVCIYTYIYIYIYIHTQVVLAVKKLPENEGDVRDVGWISGSGRYPGEGNGNPFQYSSPRIPWTEELGWLQSIGSQRVGHSWSNLAWMYVCMCVCVCVCVCVWMYIYIYILV